MKAYVQAVLEAMKKQEISTEDLSSNVKISENKLRLFLDGTKDVPLKDYIRIAQYLHLDVNEAMRIQVVDKFPYTMITNETEQYVNRIARSIHINDRKKFERAVEYLAECFDDKWRKKK